MQPVHAPRAVPEAVAVRLPAAGRVVLLARVARAVPAVGRAPAHTGVVAPARRAGAGAAPARAAGPGSWVMGDGELNMNRTNINFNFKFN